MLATNDKELIYVFSSKSNLGKKMLPYVKSINNALRTIDIVKDKLPGSIWLEIAEMSNKSLTDLFSPELHDNDTLKKPSYNTEDILKIIEKNPSLLQHPIIIHKNKAVSIKDRFDIFEFYEKDGNDFDKSPEGIKNGKHQNSTNDKGMNNSI